MIKDLHFLVKTHLDVIYPDQEYPGLDKVAFTKRLITTIGVEENSLRPGIHENLWDEKDIIAITYGDSVIQPKELDEKPLTTLKHFLDEELKGVVNSVHILPFFPYSSDDGFSVIDYVQVNDGLGGWKEIHAISQDYKLMSDLVVNHCSSRSRWFEDFKTCREPGKDYFISVPEDTDTSAVVRPRTSPLLREVETLEGKKYVWCTFSHDQVDLNFANPELLWEMVNIIKFYLEQGVKIFRFDAVAFVWKELGTPCINHPRTHEIVRLFRTLIEHCAPETIIITETNLPNHENLSYFGNANEAHAVYNFSLPPLMVHALTTGNSDALKLWLMRMPPPQHGTFYFNFIASHDGIGLRPAEGLLSDEQIGEMVNTMQSFGGLISWRATSEGANKPYEMNITLFDALQGTNAGPDKWQVDRFICAHAIMLALEGVPGIYIHSFLGTKNWSEGVEYSGQARTINRYRWDYEELKKTLKNEYSDHAKVFKRIKRLIDIRIKQPAFHPNATQFTLHLTPDVFGFWRQSLKRDQSIFCINNISDKEVAIPLSSINLISLNNWIDLLSGEPYTHLQQDLVLKPYQSVWLSNKF